MRKRCAIKHGIFKEFLAEFLGTFVLVVSSVPLFFSTDGIMGFDVGSVWLSFPAVRLRLRGSDRPEPEHAGGAAHRAHRLLRGPDDGSVRGRRGVR